VSALKSVLRIHRHQADGAVLYLGFLYLGFLYLGFLYLGFFYLGFLRYLSTCLQFGIGRWWRNVWNKYPCRLATSEAFVVELA
jgi:hypothetical protein